MIGKNGNLNHMSISELISLSKKKAVITGAASGIGRATAYRFAEAGASLDLIDIDEEKLRETQDELSDFDVETSIYKIDVSNKNEIDSYWLEKKGKEPDILVNNAGIYPMRKFSKVDEDFFDNIMKINLRSVFWMCQQMIRARRDKGGVIVNVGSIEAMLPFKEDLVHYSVSKAGVLSITRALAKEYGRKGFRVNAVVPGGILTSGTKNIAKQVCRLNLGLIKTGIEFRQRLPLARFGRPDEVARIILVLASELASYMNGALVAVDGGFLSA